MVPDVDTGDNGGLARAASIVCTAETETGRRCQGGGQAGGLVSKSTRTGNAGSPMTMPARYGKCSRGTSKRGRSSETTIVR